MRFGENVVWVQACRWAAAAALGRASRAASMRVGSSSWRLSSSGMSSEFDPRRPQLVEARRRAVLGEALHDGRRLDEGVVDAERHRAVAGRAVDPQPPPGHALLADRDADRRRFGGAVVEAAALGQEVVAADGVRVVVGDPAGAVGAAVPPRRRRRSRGRRRAAGRRWSTMSLKATAIDDVRLSMSTAPRPQTSSTPSALRDELAAERVLRSSRGRGPARRRCGPSGTGSARRGRGPRRGPRTTPGPASAPTARSSTPGPST